MHPLLCPNVPTVVPIPLVVLRVNPSCPFVVTPPISNFKFPLNSTITPPPVMLRSPFSGRLEASIFHSPISIFQYLTTPY